jgi:hypothetical protein
MPEWSRFSYGGAENSAGVTLTANGACSNIHKTLQNIRVAKLPWRRQLTRDCSGSMIAASSLTLIFRHLPVHLFIPVRDWRGR